MNSARYDCAVVGSSPLLLMLALQLRRENLSVVLFEVEKNPGGAWQVENVDGIGPVECACHLLEWYAGTYNKLEQISGIRFIKSVPQPVRIFGDGSIVTYTSRHAIVREIYASARAVAGAVWRLFASGGQAPSERLDLLWGRLDRLVFQLRYRAPALLFYDGVRRPENGYVDFVSSLYQQVEASGAQVIHAKATGVQSRSGHVDIRYEGGSVVAGKVFLGDSTDMADLPETYSSKQDILMYHHVVIGVPAHDVLLRNDYVHLPDDDKLHRITYVRDVGVADHGGEAIFLVQLRRAMSEIEDFHLVLSNALKRCHIVADAEGVIIHREFSKPYVQRPARRLRMTSTNVQRVGTIGDLSRSVALESRLLFRKTKRASQKMSSPASDGGREIQK